MDDSDPTSKSPPPFTEIPIVTEVLPGALLAIDLKATKQGDDGVMGDGDGFPTLRIEGCIV
jgi:hypothetical protein